MNKEKYYKVLENEFEGFNTVLRIPNCVILEHLEKYGYFEPLRDVSSKITNWERCVMNSDQIYFHRDTKEEIEEILDQEWVKELKEKFTEETEEIRKENLRKIWSFKRR